ncbi:uncharacterized protein LOC109821431 [Asparagus officinalis]|uniref:uncharacterized protein LOC109821431 n=1 Tax=Asparagus officinalis TaxID=4686 RepID=UPI00098E1F10|nr:uncharacterized protein LOC109821431 [Asparagus officinalis]
MTSLIIWDEAPMVHKHAFEAVDRTFKDILGAECSENVNKPFGGKTFVLGGDFRQILLVIPKGSKHDILHASISCSYLWRDCKVLTLTKNMRLQTQVSESNTMSNSDFSKWVLDIGNGDNMCKKNAFHDQDLLVEIPDNFIIHANGNPIDEVISSTYPRLMQNYSNEEYLEERVILIARNEVVDIINNEILDIVPGEYVTYLSSDSICPTSPNLASNEILYPTKFLNSQKFPGMPNHEIKLKVGTPIMLLRNLSPADGICNGTRLVITQLLKWIIEARIISGSNIGTKHFISRTDMTNTDSKCYKITLEVEDYSVVSTITLFNKEAEKLFKVSADEMSKNLVKDVFAQQNSDVISLTEEGPPTTPLTAPISKSVLKNTTNVMIKPKIEKAVNNNLVVNNSIEVEEKTGSIEQLKLPMQEGKIVKIQASHASTDVTVLLKELDSCSIAWMQWVSYLKPNFKKKTRAGLAGGMEKPEGAAAVDAPTYTATEDRD